MNCILQRCCVAVASALWLVMSAWPTDCAADQFALLESDARAMQARVDLIQQAEHEICIAYYAVDLGVVPVATLELLRQASCRGVSVRLIVDGLISRVPSRLEAYLQRAGVQIRVYHPPAAGQPIQINRRMHVKCMVVDSRHVIIGSRNLKDEHFGLDDENYTDCDAYASGDIGAAAQKYFDWLWRQPDLSPPPADDSLILDVLRLGPLTDSVWAAQWRGVESPAGYQRLLTRSLAELARRMPIEYDSGNDWMRMSIPVSQTGLLNDRFTDKRDLVFQRRIASLITGARCAVWIETPYPVFTPPICEAICSASRRGVAVTVVTNSLATTDRPWAYAAYHNDKRKLLSAGVALYEVSGPKHFHAKSMVVDDRLLAIGSYNFDPRSSRSNLELNLLVCDPAAAALMRGSILSRAAGATRAEVRCGRATVGPGASLAERVQMQSARLAVTAIRWLL